MGLILLYQGKFSIFVEIFQKIELFNVLIYYL